MLKEKKIISEKQLKNKTFIYMKIEWSIRIMKYQFSVVLIDRVHFS